MSFAYPTAWALLILIPPVFYVVWLGIRKKRRILEEFEVEPAGPRWWGAHVSMGLLLVLVLSLVSLVAQPYTYRDPGEMSADYVFVVDVSRSMEARNRCEEPSRLERAKRLMRSVMEDIPEARFSVMAFAGLAFPLAELSYDRSHLFEVVDHGLYKEVVGQPGSDIANALRVVVEKKTLEPHLYEDVEQVILISDGDITQRTRAELEGAVAALQDADISVISVGSGSREGRFIPQFDEEGRCIPGGFERVRGVRFVTHLVEEPLRSVAERTGGAYFTEYQATALIAHLRNALRDEALAERPEQRQDLSRVFAFFGAVSLFLLVLRGDL